MSARDHAGREDAAALCVRIAGNKGSPLLDESAVRVRTDGRACAPARTRLNGNRQRGLQRGCPSPPDAEYHTHHVVASPPLGTLGSPTSRGPRLAVAVARAARQRAFYFFVLSRIASLTNENESVDLPVPCDMKPKPLLGPPAPP